MAIRSEEHFPKAYSAARERFLAVAKRRGAAISSHPIAARSPRGEELAIDSAYLGPDAPECVLVVSSGLHGVEGFAGSAVQHRLLADQLDGLNLPRSCGLLVVHALNPHGFASVRRVNENNVDLNRNFLRHPEEHVPNPDYDELYDAINPTDLEPEVDARNRMRLLAYGQAHGMSRLQAVLTVGQYVHPEGVQFGGQAPEASNAAVLRLAVTETRGADRVAWIDVHTGLGPFGEVELISESSPEADDFLRARAWWGDAVRSTASGESVSAAVHGSIEKGLCAVLRERDLTVVAAEFGTYDPARVFAAMRADNWLVHHGDPDSEQGVAIKQELLEVFRPADPKWGARVLEVAEGLVERARDGLAARR